MNPLQSEEKLKEVNELYQLVIKANEEYFQFWLKNTLFHWDFWTALIIFTIIPIVFWLKFRKKESTGRLLFVGMFVLIISSWLDLLGVLYGKWYYTGKVIPSIPAFIPWDWVIMPILVMTLIQIKPQSSPIIKGLILASMNTFIGEPLLKWLGFYVTMEWDILYSFPIYFVIYLIAHWLSKAKSFNPI